MKKDDRTETVHVEYVRVKRDGKVGMERKKEPEKGKEKLMGRGKGKGE